MVRARDPRGWRSALIRGSRPCVGALAYVLLLVMTRPAPAQDTPLDQRRLAFIANTDAAFTLGPQDATLPTPNRTLKNAGQQDYLCKVLAVFARVQQGTTASSRLSEANQLLRYALNAWPATGTGSLIGQYASAWNHRDRSLGTRVYFLYRDYLDPDIRQNFEQRLDYAVTSPYNQSSENIKATSNALIYLAHESRNQTHLSSFAAIRSWWINFLRNLGNESFFEWGSPYHFWTLGAVQNLAEFAEDIEIRTLATMVVDYTYGCMAGFSIDGWFNAAAVRRWYWTFCTTEPHTGAIRTLFFDAPPYDYFTWVEWAISNYRPLTAVDAMFHNTRRSETTMTLVDRWHMYSYVMDRAAISTHHTLADNYYGNPGETHDLIQCIVQSIRGDKNHVITYAIQPNVQKYRCTHDRSFGYQNVAIVNGGGFTRKAWSGGTIANVPIRLFRSAGFSVTFDSGWAFLNDGDVYVAWAPTIGSPIHDPDSATFAGADCGGAFLRSDYTPDDLGEAAVVEVGDPESFGSFTAFRNEIKSRNARPRWSGNKVVYTARDGSRLEFGTNYASVNGVLANLAAYARMDSTLGIVDYAFQLDGGQSITFDFNNAQVTGPLNRLGASRYYGFGSAGNPPVAVVSASPLGGLAPLAVQFDGSGSYDVGGAIVSYEWDFDGNGTIDATGPTAAHIYRLRGTFAATLKVTDGEGLTDTASIEIEVAQLPGDLDGDGDVDGPDGDCLRACLSGANVPQSDPACDPADMDHDGDVDQSDFALLQLCHSGNGFPADPNCME